MSKSPSKSKNVISEVLTPKLPPESIFNVDQEAIFTSVVADVRAKYIPARFNQIKTLDHLTSSDVEVIVDISNRLDGKSTGYLIMLLNLSVQLNIIPLYLTFSFFEQDSVIEEIDDIEKMYPDMFNWSELSIDFDKYLKKIYYKNELIGVIGDLAHYRQYKKKRVLLKQCSIIFIDEFLKYDYDPLEYTQLRTIYQTMNAYDSRPYVKNIKTILAGNPINYTSPLIHGFDIIDDIHKSKVGQTYQSGHILIRREKNDQSNVNKDKNSLWIKKDDNMVTAEFDYNNYHVIDGLDLTAKPSINLKISSTYVSIYLLTTGTYLLSCPSNLTEPVTLSDDISDINEEVKLIDGKFYDREFISKNSKLKNIYFTDNFVKSFFIDKMLDFNIKRAVSALKNLKMTNDIIEKRRYVEKAKTVFMTQYF